MRAFSMGNYHSLVMPLLSKWFANRDHQFGHTVIAETMVVWTSQLVGHPVTNDDKPTFSHAASKQPALYHTLQEWSQGYWAYLKLPEQEKVARFIGLTSEVAQVGTTSRAARNDILKVLSTLNTDDGIRFMAILAAEWARSFNITGFEQMLGRSGHSPASETVDDESSAAVTALWLMDIDFQLA